MPGGRAVSFPSFIGEMPDGRDGPAFPIHGGNVHRTKGARANAAGFPRSRAKRPSQRRHPKHKITSLIGDYSSESIRLVDSAVMILYFNNVPAATLMNKASGRSSKNV